MFIAPYLFHLSHDFVNFRLPELKSVSEIINQPECLNNCTYNDESPIFTSELLDEQIAQQLAKRSVFIKSVSKLFFQSDSFETLLTKIGDSNLIKLNSNETFKIDVYTYGKIYTQREKVEKIEKLIDALKFTEGVKVCLKDDLVNHRFVYFEEWILKQTTNRNPEIKLDESDGPIIDESNDSTDKYLKQVYFGKFICEGLNNQIHKL